MVWVTAAINRFMQTLRHHCRGRFPVLFQGVLERCISLILHPPPPPPTHKSRHILPQRTENEGGLVMGVEIILRSENESVDYKFSAGLTNDTKKALVKCLSDFSPSPPPPPPSSKRPFTSKLSEAHKRSRQTVRQRDNSLNTAPRQSSPLTDRAEVNIAGRYSNTRISIYIPLTTITIFTRIFFLFFFFLFKN